jgi:TfoX/Sxy family transcriptional regulator of competence genes
MAYSEELAARIRKALVRRQGVSEKKMFGGITFMLRGHMCCGVVKDELVLRLGLEQGEKALTKPYTRECDFTGRSMKGMVIVAPGGYETDDALRRWVQQAIDFVLSLPAKNVTVSTTRSSRVQL